MPQMSKETRNERKTVKEMKTSVKRYSKIKGDNKISELEDISGEII